MFEGPQKKENSIPKSPENPPISARNISNEDPNLIQDAEAQVEVDERAAAKLLDEIKSGVIKEKAVPEDEKKKLLRVNHNKWIEGTKDVVISFGYSVTTMVVADIILKKMGINIPSYIFAPMTMPPLMAYFERNKRKNKE